MWWKDFVYTTAVQTDILLIMINIMVFFFQSRLPEIFKLDIYQTVFNGPLLDSLVSLKIVSIQLVIIAL